MVRIGIETLFCAVHPFSSWTTTLSTTVWPLPSVVKLTCDPLEGPGITPFWIVQAMLCQPGPDGAGGATVALSYCCAHMVESHNVIAGELMVRIGTVTDDWAVQPCSSITLTVTPTGCPLLSAT